VFVESVETLTVTLSNATGAVLGSINTATLSINDSDTAPPSVNPIDDARFFVNQQYDDFLGRAPDQAGFDFWTNKIVQCGNNIPCLLMNRNVVSRRSLRQLSSGHRLLRLSPIQRRPRHTANVPTVYSRPQPRRRRTNSTRGQGALASDFVTREAFTTRYPAD